MAIRSNPLADIQGVACQYHVSTDDFDKFDVVVIGDGPNHPSRRWKDMGTFDSFRQAVEFVLNDIDKDLAENT